MSMKRYGYNPQQPKFKIGDRVDGQGETDYRGGTVMAWQPNWSDAKRMIYLVKWDKLPHHPFWYRDWELRLRLRREA